jgi:phosphatidylglycerol:prolipoprotein diacylglycerol transferase
MHPVLFELGSLKVYSYGVLIACGAIAGVAYMYLRGKKEIGLTIDQANSLFLFIFLAAFVGGKVFLFFEDPSRYTGHWGKLLTGSGFVFYGSFIFAVPTMLWFFRKNKLPVFTMLDIMAVTTCIVHIFGRLGCFMAGCCYGQPTLMAWGVTFTDPACDADPKNVPLHPSQLYEAGYIFLVLLVILYFRGRRVFYGQLFLTYLILYAFGRFALEYFRGDASRGYIIDGYLSHSQFIAMVIAAITLYFFVRLSSRNNVALHKKPI